MHITIWYQLAYFCKQTNKQTNNEITLNFYFSAYCSLLLGKKNSHLLHVNLVVNLDIKGKYFLEIAGLLRRRFRHAIAVILQVLLYLLSCACMGESNENLE